MSKRYVGGIVSVGRDGINSPVTEVEYLVVAGGGGTGATANPNSGAGGSGGGGSGYSSSNIGTDGLGGGGGGGSQGTPTASRGGSGKIYLRYPNTETDPAVTPGSNVITDVGSDRLITFNVSGTLTVGG